MSKKYDGIFQNMTIDFEGLITYILENVDSSILSKLEDYVKFTDYGTSNTGGVIRVSSNYGLSMNNGQLYGLTKSYSDYSSLANGALISKGTLENVITGKALNPTNYTGYDATKTQVLKNVEGTLTWVTEE